MERRLARLTEADPVMRHVIGMLVQRMRGYGIVPVDDG